jgi:hypothetical protein
MQQLFISVKWRLDYVNYWLISVILNLRRIFLLTTKSRNTIEPKRTTSLDMQYHW